MQAVITTEEHIKIVRDGRGRVLFRFDTRSNTIIVRGQGMTTKVPLERLIGEVVRDV